MDKIKSVEDISNLVASGYKDWSLLGDVRTVEKDGLILFNYSAAAQYNNRWNYFERVSRGLILDSTTGEVVARGFDKFYNWMEGGRNTRAPLKSVTEKMDGSLILAYLWKDKWQFATRGAFDSDQAVWATKYANDNLDFSSLIAQEGAVTFLFEAIYPENRIVLDYEGREELVLLAIRMNDSGEYYPRWLVSLLANDICATITPAHSFNSWRNILEAREKLTENQEGYVAEFGDGQRFKFKGDQYLRLHRLISGLSFKNTLKHVVSGTVDRLRQDVPDEFLADVNKWVVEIDLVKNQVELKSTKEDT